MTHRQISFVKSGLRLAGYILLPLHGGLTPAVVLLIISELFGIYEEVGENGKTVADCNGGAAEKR